MPKGSRRRGMRVPREIPYVCDVLKAIVDCVERCHVIYSHAGGRSTAGDSGSNKMAEFVPNGHCWQGPSIVDM